MVGRVSGATPQREIASGEKSGTSEKGGWVSATSASVAAALAAAGWFFIGNPASQVSGAVGTAVQGAASDAAVALGIPSGVKTGGAIFGESAVAYVGHEISSRADIQYRILQCESAFESIPCARETIVGLAGAVVIVTAVVGLIGIGYRLSKNDAKQG